MPTEAQLVTKIMLRLEQWGGYVNKNHGNPFQRGGRPDIEGCLRGRFIAFEVKLPGKKRTLSPLQIRALEEIRRAGGFAAVVDCLPDVEGFLRGWELI